VEDLYDILQEHVIDQLGEMILYPKKAPVSTTTSKIEKIQAVDFDVYLAKLKTVQKFCLQ